MRQCIDLPAIRFLNYSNITHLSCIIISNTVSILENSDISILIINKIDSHTIADIKIMIHCRSNNWLARTRPKIIENTSFRLDNTYHCIEPKPWCIHVIYNLWILSKVFSKCFLPDAPLAPTLGLPYTFFIFSNTVPSISNVISPYTKVESLRFSSSLSFLDTAFPVRK